MSLKQLFGYLTWICLILCWINVILDSYYYPKIAEIFFIITIITFIGYGLFNVIKEVLKEFLKK